MTRNPTTVAELMALWPSAEHFARDLGLRHLSHARIMRKRGSIASRHWDAVVVSASRRGIDGVNHRLLEAMHASRPRFPAPSEQTGAAA